MSFIKDFPLKKVGGTQAEIADAIGRGRNTSVFFAVENARYHLAAGCGSFFLYVVNDRVAARKASLTMSTLLDAEIPVLIEREDVLINSQNVSGFFLGERLRVLTAMARGTVPGVVASADALMQLYPKRSLFDEFTFHFKVGDTVNLDELAAKLVCAGYERSEENEKGKFYVKGDTVFLYGYADEFPVKLEFFDDFIEAIKSYDAETMRVVASLDSVTISPSSDILIQKADVSTIIKRVSAEIKGKDDAIVSKMRELCERLMANPSSPTLQFLLPFMREQCGSIFDYLPSKSVVVFDDVRSFDDRMKLLWNSYLIRLDNFVSGGEALRYHEKSLLSQTEVYRFLEQKTKLAFLQITSKNPLFEPQEIFTIKSQSVPKYYNNIDMLVTDIKSHLFTQTKVFIYCNTLTAKNIAGFLRDNFIGVKEIDDVKDAEEVNIIPREIKSGVFYPLRKLMIIGQEDLVRKKELSSKKKKRKDFIIPEKGDYVVHEIHGIGLSDGIQSIKTREGYKDYYVVLYAGGDKLYLPVNMLDSIEKYNGADKPTLNKLGGQDFSKQKQKVKESIKKLTFDLIKLYEKRLTLKGYKYPPDTIWQKELEDGFAYEETPDQLTAIAEIKNDMESGKIMDRLLCGDVGYGKTEVAIRAIFKTVVEGRQAAFLAPTTILAQQHFNTLSARLNEFKLKIVLLSRFVSPKQIKENLNYLKSGEANIVVATHRLLGKDVDFKDLGLLVLDEEQRFGVEHKEKIKNLKNRVNVLSLSATPIPRTLHMALSGIRDISVLETPPGNRLPIETYVTEYNDALLLDAVNREVARDGQVFILYNRVATIEAFYKHVKNVLGDVSVIYAHGQMNDDDLEDRIKLFYDREVSVMISTTIIENGIDLPFANTLIVIDADNLGLSQLYQLRGRVGRSNVLAYAYFTVREGKVLTEDAVKRLNALSEYTELGSGLKVAMRDLDIRGAGNVLGREQSGQMERMGYDMYCRLVQECMDEAVGKRTKESRDIEIGIEGDSSLPRYYIPDSKQRIRCYRNISALRSPAEAKDYLKELENVYGDVPKSVQLLVAVAVIKNLAKTLGVRRIVANATQCCVYFHDADCLSDEQFIRAVSNAQEYTSLYPTQPPRLELDMKKLRPRMAVNRLLRLLSDACGVLAE